MFNQGWEQDDNSNRTGDFGLVNSANYSDHSTCN